MSILSAVSGAANSILGSVIDNFFNGAIITGNLTADPDYSVKIFSNRAGGIVQIIAPMPESFATNTSADYDTPFANGLAGKLAKMINFSSLGLADRVGLDEETVSLGMRMAGASTTTQSMTMQVWQGSSPMEFSIPLHFVLTSDPEKDILQPLRQLMSLTLPSSAIFQNLGNIFNQNWQENTGGFLTSPGPKIKLKDNMSAPDFLQRLGEGDLVSAGGALADQATSITGSAVDAITGKEGGPDVLMEKLLASDMFNFIEFYDNISLEIGNFMRFNSVVITDVSSEHGVKLDAYSHKPIELQVTVTFRTFMTPKVEDLPNMIIS